MANGRARRLRSAATRAERHLWQYLRRRQLAGYRFRRQHPMGPFVVDFICLERRLVIELDGEVHDHPTQIDHDIARQDWLEGQGCRILRFRNDDVLHDVDMVLARVCDALGVEGGRSGGDTCGVA
jgi:very-short-patch-repair endonuclease